MTECHPNLHAAVLEWVDIFDLRQRPELLVTVAPDLQQQLQMPERQPAER
jgi:hypothetical protein